jgi:hypothetical protein
MGTGTYNDHIGCVFHSLTVLKADSEELLSGGKGECFCRRRVCFGSQRERRVFFGLARLVQGIRPGLNQIPSVRFEIV